MNSQQVPIIAQVFQEEFLKNLNYVSNRKLDLAIQRLKSLLKKLRLKKI